MPDDAGQSDGSTQSDGGPPSDTGAHDAVEGPTGFGDGYQEFGLEGVESFDPNSPTLKDGTALTDEMRTLYDGFLHAFLSGSGTWSDPLAAFSNGDQYSTARRGQISQESALAVFRLTGDLRILDRLCEAYSLLDKKMAVPWNNADLALLGQQSGYSACENDPPPWHPYRKLVWAGDSWQNGTDLRNLDVVKLRAVIAEFAWALWVNRGKVSPAGHDYSALADLWAREVENTVRAWSDDSNACWTGNYRGVDGTPNAAGIPNTLTYRTRQQWGKYPVLMRSEGHTCFNSVSFHHYLSLLGQHAGRDIPNPADAQTAARIMARSMVDESWMDCQDQAGRPSVIIRMSSVWSANANTNALRATYTAYAAWALVHARMTGAFVDIYTPERMKGLSRQYAVMHNVDGSTASNLTGEVDLCDHGLPLDDGATRPVSMQVERAFMAMSVFADESEAGGDKLFLAGTAAQNAAGGGYTTPTRAIIPAAQFVTRALQAIGQGKSL